MFRVFIEARAERMLRSLQPKLKMRIAEEIYALGIRFMDGKRLTGALKGYRSKRIGDYRLVYDVDVMKSIVRVLRMGNRKEVKGRKMG